jgi:hypothetical protein
LFWRAALDAIRDNRGARQAERKAIIAAADVRKHRAALQKLQQRK